ncbi:hypothetical protein [Mannheimia indoligenes]|uniref:hypothetical protein n=1 Tax=Mannheimia indoligenes TaxID=3103145 RepID=UPI002FE61297
MENLFKNLQKGYEDEAVKARVFNSTEELEIFLFAKLHPNDLWSSESVAYCAGQFQYYFGMFLSLRKDKVSGTPETERAEKNEELLAHNFSIMWKNAVYLHSINK